MSQDNNNVGVSIQVVPDGRWSDKKNSQEWCRISLVIRPVVDENQIYESFNLENLPGEIIHRIKAIKVGGSTSDKTLAMNGITVEIPTVRGFKRVPLSELEDSSDIRDWSDRAKEIWHYLFDIDTTRGNPSIKELFGTLEHMRIEEQQVNDSSTIEGKNGKNRPPQIFGNIEFEEEDWTVSGRLFEKSGLWQDISQLASLVNSKYETLNDEIFSEFTKAFNFMPASTPEGNLKGLEEDPYHKHKNDDHDKHQTLSKSKLESLLQVSDGQPRLLTYEFARKLNQTLKNIRRENKQIQKHLKIDGGTFKTTARSLNSSEIDSHLIALVNQALSKHTEPLSEDTSKAIDDIREIHLEGFARQLLSMRDSKLPIKASYKNVADDGNTQVTDQWEDDASLRRLSGITSYPRLAKILGFTIDLDVPVSQLELGNVEKGQIWVDIGKGQSHPSSTLFSLTEIFFGPHSDVLAKTGDTATWKSKLLQPELNGYLNLDTRRDYPAPVAELFQNKRFMLRSLNDQAVTYSTHRMIRQRENEIAYEERSEEIEKDNSIFQSHGISLIDRECMVEMKKEAVQSELHAFADENERVTLSMKNLISGYRFDIGVIHPKKNKEEERVDWRSANERRITFPGLIEEFFPDELSNERKANEPWLFDRDAVLVQTAAKIMKRLPDPEKSPQDDMNPKDKYSAVVRTEVQSYHGWSLALPSKSSAVSLENDTNRNPKGKDELPIPLLLEHPPREIEGPAGEKPVPNTLPVLRFGLKYIFACRVGYINGGGLSWREAYERIYSTEEFTKAANAVKQPSVIGDERGEAFQFLRSEPILPPDFLWAAGLMPSTIATGSDKSNSSIEQINIPVIRSGDDWLPEDILKPSYRVVVAPRVPQAFAELHGVFDQYRGRKIPPGAFPNFELCPQSGKFPALDDQSCSQDIEVNRAPSKRSQKNSPIDAIAIPVSRREEPRSPYYTDPLAQRIAIAVVDSGGTIKDVHSLSGLPIFLDKEKIWPSKAKAYLLCLKQTDEENIRIEVSKLPKGIAKKWKSSVEKIVTIYLPPAEDVDLSAWCTPDDRFLGENNIALHANKTIMKGRVDLQELLNENSLSGDRIHPSATAVRGLLHEIAAAYETNKFSGHTILSEKLSAATLKFIKENEPPSKAGPPSEAEVYCGPVSQIVRDRKIRLVHAVQRPVDAPALVDFCMVRLDISGETIDDEDAMLKNWDQYVNRSLASGIKLECWESEENGVPVFIGGNISFHRKSTERIDILGHWMDFSPKKSIRLKDGIYYFEPAPVTDKLASLGQLNKQVKMVDDTCCKNGVEGFHFRENDISLRRMLFHTFGDHKARRLIIDPEAYSCFSSYFQGLEGEQKPVVASYKIITVECGNDKKHDCQKEVLPSGVWIEKLKSYTETLGRSFFVKRGENYVLTLKSTRRPPPPKVNNRTIPSLIDVTSFEPGLKKITTVHEAATRIHLEGDWYASGEGEQLAVVCGPESVFNPNQAYRIFDVKRSVVDLNSLGRLEPYITRWGADPGIVSGGIEEAISPERYLEDFNHKNLGRKQKKFPGPFHLPLPTKDKSAGCPVYIAAYTPHLDPNTGKWYCDVSVDPGNSFFPFVRFGLARYQPNSLENFELSNPVGDIWTLLAPKRTATVQYKEIEGGWLLNIQIKGIGYTKKNMALSKEYDSLVDRPHLSLKIMEEVRSENVKSHGGTPVIGTKGLLDGFECSNVAPTSLSNSWKIGQLRGSEMVWRFDGIFVPNKTANNLHRYILITEKSFYAVDNDILRPDCSTLGSIAVDKRGIRSTDCSSLGSIDTMSMRVELDD